MAPLVEALAQAVEAVGEQGGALADASGRTVDALRLILGEGRDTAEAEAARFRAECYAAEADTVRSLSGVLAAASARAFDDRVRALDRRTAALVALGLFGMLLAGACAGWWAGNRSARTAIVETEEGLRAAFREGPDAARLWLDLMNWNDPKASLSVCREPGENLLQNGRRACRVPLWVERPPAAGRP